MKFATLSSLVVSTALCASLARSQLVTPGDLALGGTHEAMFQRASSEDDLFEREIAQAQLDARADSDSTTSTAATTTATSSAASTTATGDVVTVTLSGDTADPSGCSMTDALDRGQSASWTTTYASTCCVNATYATCFGRIQAYVNGSEQCYIPPCTILIAGNETLMAGFTPLSSSSGGVGEYKNSFLIVKASSALSDARVAIGGVASIALLAAGFALL